jgi:RHH-type proline utilization regulon transcriptional repressor/proline dehydrogenase/delta 1-pyrroline-5-carboxylate dehydrogenase
MLNIVEGSPFQNEPLTDFSLAENRTALAEALQKIDARIQAGEFKAFPIVDGTHHTHGEQTSSVDPADPEVAVGSVTYGDSALAKEALERLNAAADSWADTPVEDRAATLMKAAQLMRIRKHELSSVIIREAGKPWKEADADVAEAIDFCEYYAEEMVKLAKPSLTQEVLGEQNIYFYQPRGVAVVIAPWNFPLAIPCGMTVAALVTGNTTLLKPAEQSSIIAHLFAEILYEAGIPKEAFAFLPGKGEEVGPLLIEHPEVDLICFTGSRDVGLHIIQTAAKVVPGQRNVKKVICEMGGKNAVIIDSDADLDEAVKGVLYSAFGFSGQKCSACSRAIIVGDAYEIFLKRLCEATKDIAVDRPREPFTYVGPLIDQDAQQRVLDAIEKCEKEGTLAFKGGAPSTGYFIPPTIFRDVTPESWLWGAELFAPVLACTQADSFEHALELANDSEYALTGGLFSRSPGNIEVARKKFKVGNLYINRGCTGAIVCRQPFGGFRMSGVGSKAGGPDYLLQFLEPRTVTENTMRRGFSPDLI